MSVVGVSAVSAWLLCTVNSLSMCIINLCHVYICLLLCFRVKEIHPVLKGKGVKVCVGTSWGAGSMFWSEPSLNAHWSCAHYVFCCSTKFQSYWSWPSSSLLLGTEGYKFPGETFSWVRTKLKDKHILGTFISKSCLPEQSPDLSRLPSLILLFIVCQCVLCPRCPWPFYQESSTTLQRLKRFSPSALQAQSLRYRVMKCVDEGY